MWKTGHRLISDTGAGGVTAVWAGDVLADIPSCRRRTAIRPHVISDAGHLDGSWGVRRARGAGDFVAAGVRVATFSCWERDGGQAGFVEPGIRIIIVSCGRPQRG